LGDIEQLALSLRAEPLGSTSQQPCPFLVLLGTRTSPFVVRHGRLLSLHLAQYIADCSGENPKLASSNNVPIRISMLMRISSPQQGLTRPQPAALGEFRSLGSLVARSYRGAGAADTPFCGI
jgi:hypothetical protein